VLCNGLTTVRAHDHRRRDRYVSAHVYQVLAAARYGGAETDVSGSPPPSERQGLLAL
jgi:hypothetical protein